MFSNIAKLEDLIKVKDNKLKRLNLLVIEGYEGNVKPKPKVNYDDGRHQSIIDGLVTRKERRQMVSK